MISGLKEMPTKPPWCSFLSFLFSLWQKFLFLSSQHFTQYLAGNSMQSNDFPYCLVSASAASWIMTSPGTLSFWSTFSYVSLTQWSWLSTVECQGTTWITFIFQIEKNLLQELQKNFYIHHCLLQFIQWNIFVSSLEVFLLQRLSINNLIGGNVIEIETRVP